jgi:hypothetical protein
MGAKPNRPPRVGWVVSASSYDDKSGQHVREITRVRLSLNKKTAVKAAWSNTLCRTENSAGIDVSRFLHKQAKPKE